MFICIDIFTRFLWTELMLNKSTLEAIRAFKKILSTIPEYPYLCLADKGGEFKSKAFNQFCLNNKIKLIHSDVSGKAAFAERVIRSIERLIYSYCIEHETKKFYHILPNI